MEGIQTPPSSDRARSASAASGRWGWLLLAALAAAVFALDQFTKSLAVRNLEPMGPAYHEPLLGEWLRLSFATNTGAAFGLFRNQTIPLTIIALAAIPLLVFAQRYLPVTGWGAKIAVGLLLGGTLGNLADRIRQGYVVDFIDAGAGRLRWPTFNIADSAFVIGVLLLLLFVFLNSETRAPRDAA